ncbi:GerAB/ArcD/ProY family transporter [Paenibacillus sp. Soil750]|uniref:GerAB/ArcD/ProY family transporter n=1 Tax=Paenibacillus sp. Soil750 TaxID=1736398 RepID=UPI0006F722AA|nr:endospore germination permease [Paenibacillus sp. Soil750]KRE72921.1 hypothetical protein ASL11_07735 [Paenibacillus sp. Soil750]
MKQDMTTRQAAMWFILFQLGSAFLLLPRVLAGTAEQDAWLSVLFAIGAFFLILPLYTAIAKQLEETSISDHILELFGRIGGKFLLFGFVVGYPYLIYILVLRDLSDFLTTSVIPETPAEAILVLMMAAVIYIVRSGTAVIGRTAEILFFIVMLLFAFGYASLIPSAEMSNLMPVLEHGWKPILLAAFSMLIFPYAETVLFLFLMPSIRQAHKWKTAVIKSSLVSGCMFLLMTILTICVLSDGVVSNVMYPSYFAVRTISIGDFYERFEVLVAVLWYITIFYRLSLFLHVSVHGMAIVLGMQDPRPLLIPLSLIALVMANIIRDNTAEYTASLQVWPFYSMFFGIFFPILIWVVGIFKRAKNSKRKEN